ncbi:MAG: GntR family transcriptional regulator, partial [Planctomycetes bacterium]|nr:GntR family transcriptional regulator [Planctomycetota bacterium]
MRMDLNQAASGLAPSTPRYRTRHGKPPMYHRVTETLRRRLVEGNWAAGVKLPTLREMAEEFKVSTNTIRSALRILEKEGCVYHVPEVGAFVHPSYPTRTGLRTAIALAMIDLGGGFEMGIARGVEHACQERGWGLQIYDARTDATIEGSNLTRLTNSDTRGGIVMPIGNNANLEHLVKLKLAGYPVVLVDRGIIGLNVDVVESDNEKGALLATECLIRHGHHRLFMVTFPISPVAETSIVSRVRGFEQAMLAHGLEPTRGSMMWIDPEVSARGVREGHRWLAGREAAVPVLKTLTGPIGIFALNDYAAWGVVEACRELRLRIPDDVSVVCFDDSDITRALAPRLTVVAQQPGEIGRKAVELLERRLQPGGLEL